MKNSVLLVTFPVQAVFKLATDQSSGVRREVCIAFCNLVSVHPELLQAHLPQLIEYMLVSNQVRGQLKMALLSAGNAVSPPQPTGFD